MGCNNSRLNPNGGDVMPARIRPLLRRRIEELRKRRNGAALRGGEGTLSKKQLLNDDGALEDGHSQSSDENETGAPKETQALVRALEKLSKVVPLPVSECESEEDRDQEKGKDVEKKGEEVVVVVEVKTEKVNNAGSQSQPEKKHDEEEEEEEEANAKHDSDDDDDDDDGYDENGRLICLGSPSFRIYCIEAEKRKEEEIREY